MKRPSPRGLAWSACLVGSIAASTAHAQLPQGKHAPAARVARAARSFSLFGALGATGVRVDANRVDCNGLTDHGNACAGGSGTVEGAFWPAGTQDNYVYQGGLQVGALVPGNAGFGWAGDTVGVYFVDARGAQVQSSTVTGIFDSRNANDLAAWPTAALANDPSLFNAALIGRQAVSDQDTWVRYWDGNPALSVGRRHMMGLVVDQRSLAWNRPFHQDVLYFIYRLINVTSRRPQSYAGLAAAGYSAADRQQLAALGAQFQDSAKGREPALVFPDSGYVFRNLYVGYFQDPDVGIAADHNYSTAVLPFSLVAAMKTNYAEPMWQYPPAVFGSPSYRAPGYEAVQFLRSAVDSAGRQVGISVWSNTTGAGILTDPVGVSQLYRYLTGHPSPSLGDGTCNVLDAIRLHTCVALQAYADTRYWESTGPTDLGPGQSMVIAVAMLFAAPVAQWAATTNGIYAMPAGTLQAYINGNSEETFLPGWPALPETLAVIGTAGGSRVCTTACNNAATIRDAIERPMGWGQFSDANGDGRIEAGEVQTVPGSLLHKAQVAQALFDNKFLLPMAPDAPTFYLVPGDGQVTVVWQKSLTETVCTGCGDPYFPVASAPLEPDGSPNPLYDPDYRQYDVEGYRIWRGTSVANLRVVAQFDYAGTQLTDYTGQGWDLYTYGNQCAPELGVTTSCPAFPHAYPLAGDVVQVPLGGRVLLADGSVAVFQADTAVTGGASGLPPLGDNGVPFVFIDKGATNSFPYVYAVTAFDINSIRSGPSSFESPLVTKTVTPRVPASNTTAAVLVMGMFGSDSVPLDSAAPNVTVDTATGVFGGLVPPANGASFTLGPNVLDALPPGDIVARIDSVSVGFTTDIATPPPNLYVSFMAGTDTVHGVVPMPSSSFSASPYSYSDIPFAASAPLVTYDTVRAKRLGLPGGYAAAARIPVTLSGVSVPLSASDPGNALVQGRYFSIGPAGTTSQYLLHAVWYNEGGSEPPQPTVNPFGSAAHTNGTLTGVDLIYQPAPYRVPISGGAAVNAMSVTARYVIYGEPAAYYPADFLVTWNADSSLTVRDSTHRVFLPFRTDLGPGWGFVNERLYTAANMFADGNGASVPTVVGYHHMYGLSPACSYISIAVTCTVLQRKAEYEQIDYQNQGVSGGNGIMLYIDGMFFVMKMSSLPAAGTTWHLKAVSGILGATCPSLPTTPGNVPAACSSYSYTPPAARPAYVPGLTYKLRVTRGFEVATASGDLTRIHTVPDPYYNHSGYETAGSPRQLRFVNLPDRAIIRIYSTSGILVRVLTHNDATGGGEEPWDLLTREGLLVASGVYFYHVEAADGRTRVGRMTIVNMTLN